MVEALARVQGEVLGAAPGEERDGGRLDGFSGPGRRTRQKLPGAIVGEGTTIHPKVIELAGDAANGVQGQVWLGPATPVPLLQDLTARYKAKFNMLPDHNAMQGYMIMYMIKTATEKAGKVDRQALGDTLHSMTFDPKTEPGLLVDSHFQANGDLISGSYLAEITGGAIHVLGPMPE